MEPRRNKENRKERMKLVFKWEGQDQHSPLPSLPTLHPSSWPESSSSTSSSSSSSSLPCAQGCSLGKGRSYLPLTQPPWINAGHRCCTAQTHTLIAAMASKLLLSPVSIHVLLFAYVYICPSLQSQFISFFICQCLSTTDHLCAWFSLCFSFPSMLILWISCMFESLAV